MFTLPLPFSATFTLATTMALLSPPAIGSDSDLVTASIAVDCGGTGGFELSDGFLYRPDCRWPFCLLHGHRGGTEGSYATPEYLFTASPRRDRQIFIHQNLGINSHRFNLSPGTWELSLRFAEIEADGPGLRVQRITAGNQLLADSLDIYAQVGKARALDLRRVVDVPAPPLEILFEPIIGATSIAGITLRKLDAPEDPPPPVSNLEAIPSLEGSTLIRWNLSSQSQVDGYQVAVTTGSGDTLWNEHRYAAWARVPAGADLRCSVAPRGATGAFGAGTSINNLPALDPETLPLDVFHLEIDPTDLAAMEAALLDGEKLNRPATLFTNGGDPADGEVHFRGATSLRDPKKSFKFKRKGNRSEEEPRRVNLVAGFQDQTILHEVLSCQALAGAEIDVYQTTPCAVVLNGEPIGLFQEIEEPDEAFLERLGLDPNGRAYKINCDLAPTTEQLRPLWCYENLNAVDWMRDDIIHLIQELNSALPPDQETFLHQNFDLDQVIDWYCGMVYVANGDMSVHNFLMYRPREGGLWSLYPWDMDGTWGALTEGAELSTREHPDFLDRYNRIADLLLRQPRLKLRYLRRLAALLDDGLSTPTVTALVADLIDQSQAVGLADPYKRDREDNATYINSLNYLLASPAIRDTALRASIAELMPPWWVDLSINEITLSPGPSGIEITSQAPAALELKNLYLSDDPAAPRKWSLPEFTLEPGGLASFPLPPEAATATWIGLAAGGGAIIDSTTIPPPGSGPALGRYPDGYGRFRLLPAAGIGQPNNWETPVTLQAETDHQILHRGDPLRLSFAADNSWRNSLNLEIVVSAEAENGLRQPGPPLYQETFLNLGPGDAIQGAFALRVPDSHRYVLDGRNDLIVTAYERANHDRLATVRVPLFVVAPTSDTPLQINEICAKNTHVIADEAGEFEDWTELINPSADPVELSDYFLTDDLEDDPFRWNLPEGTLAPGEHLLIWLDKDPEQGPLHANFKLRQEGEELALVQAVDGSPVTLDYLPFGYMEADQSIGRYPDGTTAWELFPQPTPNGVNHDPAL